MTLLWHKRSHKLFLLTYFLLNTLTHILSALLATAHVILATKALFIPSVFLMPSPPTHFGVQIESQLLSDVIIVLFVCLFVFFLE